VIELARVIPIALQGRGNMGSVTDAASVARARLANGTYGLLYVNVSFSGGSGSATMTIKLDHRKGPVFDRTIHTLAAVGTGGTAFQSFRVPEDELQNYLCFTDQETKEQDVIVSLWTDPDGATDWALEYGLYQV